MEQALYRYNNAGSSGFSVNKAIDPAMDQCRIIVLLPWIMDQVLIHLLLGLFFFCILYIQCRNHWETDEWWINISRMWAPEIRKWYNGSEKEPIELKQLIFYMLICDTMQNVLHKTNIGHSIGVLSAGTNGSSSRPDNARWCVLTHS